MTIVHVGPGFKPGQPAISSPEPQIIELIAMDWLAHKDVVHVGPGFSPDNLRLAAEVTDCSIQPVKTAPGSTAVSAASA